MLPLASPVAPEIERNIANYVAIHKGFGPKQSRNLLQALGLTRFEIPIDSRVTKWLNEFGFPIRFECNCLGLTCPYYEFVSDGVKALCARCEVFPWHSRCRESFSRH